MLTLRMIYVTFPPRKPKILNPKQLYGKQN